MPRTRSGMAIDILSSLPGVSWPALAELASSQLLSLVWQLDQSQWWSPELLREYQLRQLQQIVVHACKNVPWYREQLGRHEPVRSGRLEAVWPHLPLLTRVDIQSAGTLLHSTALPPGHGSPYPTYTGGSTGRPVMVLGTDVVNLFWRAITLRDHLWHERDFSRVLGVIRYASGSTALPPDGQRSNGWGTSTAGVIRTGDSVLLNITSTITEQLKWLSDLNPDYFLTYPSVLHGVASEAIRTGMTVPNLKQLRTFGEVLEPRTRELCRQALGTDVVDLYSTQEVGYVALQCPEHDHYHVQSEHLLVEVLDDNHVPCQPGDIGRVVITTLHNFAMPLIRYDIGDYAEVGDTCPCGRGLPVLRRILGRQRNLFQLPNGERRWPAFELDPTSEFEGELPISQFQVIQKSLEELEVRLVSMRHLTQREEEGLQQKVFQWLGHPFRLRFEYVSEIPRGPTGKFEDFRCDLTPNQ